MWASASRAADLWDGCRCSQLLRATAKRKPRNKRASWGAHHSKTSANLQDLPPAKFRDVMWQTSSRCPSVRKVTLQRFQAKTNTCTSHPVVFSVTLGIRCDIHV